MNACNLRFFSFHLTGKRRAPQIAPVIHPVRSSTVARQSKQSGAALLQPRENTQFAEMALMNRSR
jgi:hypothetical protein